MLERNRLHDAKVVGGVIACVALVALVLYAANKPNQVAHGYGAKQSPAKQSRDTLQGVPAAPIRPVAGDQAPPRKPNPNREEWRDEKDLEAQQEMARWAWWMMVASFASVLVTGVGVWFVKHTLDATRAAVKEAEKGTKAAADAVAATREANNLLRDSAAKELRAYISVEPGGINQLIGRRESMGHVVVCNVGKLPARDVSIVARMSPAIERWIDPPPVHDFENVSRVIQPGAAVRQGTKETFPIWNFQTSDGYIFVWGAVYYGDGFGKRRFTRFCHRYPIASRNRTIDLENYATETIRVIDSDKARYHTDGNEAD
jgi:hypothetical protein